MFKTGDFGCIKNGLLYFEGRRDTQIKIRGHRVDVMEVEKSVNKLDYVLKSVILVYHATQIDQAVVDFIVLKDSVVKTYFEVERDLKSYLAPYMVPQVLIFKDFPCLVNGKVDRQKLLQMYEENITTVRRRSEMTVEFKDVDPEKQSIAKKVFEIIGQCLGNELRGDLTGSSNFFELGGNSMNTVFTVTKLHEMGFYIKLTDFINAQNLRTMLKKISTRKPKTTDIQSITNMELVAIPINDNEKEDCFDLIATSFFHKSDMEQFLEGVQLDHYKEILEKLWSYFMADGLSFMVKNSQKNLVGVSLGLDAAVELNLDGIRRENVVMEVFEFLNSIEEPIL